MTTDNDNITKKLYAQLLLALAALETPADLTAEEIGHVKDDCHALLDEVEALAAGNGAAVAPVWPATLLSAARDMVGSYDRRSQGYDLPWGTLREAIAEATAREAGWVTIDEGGWDGNLICHRDHLEDRNGKEYGSWQECCADQQLVTATDPKQVITLAPTVQQLVRTAVLYDDALNLASKAPDGSDYNALYSIITDMRAALLNSPQQAITDLRVAGYAVVVFSPEELGDVEPSTLQNRLVELGNEAISDLTELT